MFALSGYLADVQAVKPHVTADDRAALCSRMYRFRGSVPDMRLPKDVSALDDLLSDGDTGPVALHALTEPRGWLPLSAVDGCRRAALLVAARHVDDEPVLASVTLTVRPAATKHGQPELVGAALDLARGSDAMLDLLQRMWDEAEPAARTTGSAADALWLGGSPALHGAGFLDAVRGAGAVHGLDVEIVPDATRRVRQVPTRVADTPPQYLVSWVRYAYGTEPVVAAYRRATEEGEVVELHEDALDDALVEFRWAMDGLGLTAPAGPAQTGETRVPPGPGDERFYTKGTGSGVGDLMIDVADCGHGRWGSDARRLAPRAYKGIGYKEGVMPKALSRCGRCTKHRWRARW